MITYISDLDIVINKYINDNLSPAATDNLTSQLANMLKYNNVDRVFNQGLTVNGPRIGNYSPKYAKFRAKRGKQVGFINMYFTGRLKDDYTIKKTPTGYKIGINSDRSDNIVRGIQQRKSITLFGVSDTDNRKIDEIINKFLTK